MPREKSSTYRGVRVRLCVRSGLAIPFSTTTTTVRPVSKIPCTAFSPRSRDEPSTEHRRTNLAIETMTEPTARIVIPDEDFLLSPENERSRKSHKQPRSQSYFRRFTTRGTARTGSDSNFRDQRIPNREFGRIMRVNGLTVDGSGPFEFGRRGQREFIRHMPFLITFLHLLCFVQRNIVRAVLIHVAFVSVLHAQFE